MYYRFRITKHPGEHYEYLVHPAEHDQLITWAQEKGYALKLLERIYVTPLDVIKSLLTISPG